MKTWIPAPVWTGETVYILGGGPSLKDFNFNKLRHKLVIGCNDAYALGSEICDVIHFADTEWLDIHLERLNAYKGTITTTARLNGLDSRLRTLKRYETGLHVDGIGYNGNTGLSALNLALLYGATTVYLLGFDMQLGEDGQANWHPNEVNEPDERHYARFLSHIDQVTADWKSKFPNTRIINLNPESKMTAFPKRDGRKHKWHA